MVDSVEVSFVMAFPGWEVLYYFKGGWFETAPVIAWAIQAIDGEFIRAVPVTADLAWSIQDDRAICSPDGDVTLGELERWPTVWAWVADMERRETEEPDKLPPERSASPSADSAAPLVLDNYRRRFQRQDGDQ